METIKSLLPEPPKSPKSAGINKKTLGYLITGLICGLIVGYVLFDRPTTVLSPTGKELTRGDSKTAANKSTNPTSSSDLLSVKEQIPGDVVLVDRVVMEKAGWVAIHDDLGGQPGNILGAYYLPAGEHSGQLVPLLRGMKDETSYIAVIHNDDGDKVFDYKLDLPRLNNGQMEATTFSVVAASPRGN